MSAGLALRTCQHSFCHADFEFRQKSINSCFLRIHISAMLFCTSDIPWNFREASVSIHFIISYIDCHELCRVTKSQGRWAWWGWKSDRILSLTGLGVYFSLSRPGFLPWAGLEAYFSFPRPVFRTWLFKMVDIISLPGSSCLFSHLQTRCRTKTIQIS